MYGQNLNELTTQASIAGVLGSASVSTESISAFVADEAIDVRQDLTFAVEAAKDIKVPEEALVSLEYEDNAPHMDPVVLTVAVSKQLTTTEEDLISNWAPIKLIPKGDASGFIIDMPYYMLTIYEGGVQKDIKLSDLDIEGFSPDIGSAKIVPTWTLENQQYFDVATKRTGTESEFTASYLVGKDIPLFTASSEQKDISGAVKGKSDVVRHGGRLGFINIEVTDGTDTETLRVDLDEAITKDNVFTPPLTGKLNEEKLSSTIYVALDADTQVLIDANSIVTGNTQTSALIPAKLGASESVVLSIDVEATNDIKAKIMRVKSISIDFLKSVINGASSEVSALAGIRDLTFTAKSFDPVVYLTNSNHRELGKFITHDSQSVMLTTEPRGILTSDMPTDSQKRVPADTTHAAILRQSQVIKTDMAKLFVSEIGKFAKKLRSATIIDMPLGIVGENCVRNVYLEETYAYGNVTVQKSNQVMDVEKEVLQDKIESMVKDLVTKSGWSTIKYSGANSYIVRILANEDIYLGNFTMRDTGVTAKVTKSIYMDPNKIYVSLEAVGGPSISGVKLLQTASMIMRVPTTYAGTRVDGTADYKSISTSPEYKVEFKLGVLGVITLTN